MNIPNERIERLIFVVRGQKIILASDLAGLYGVTTKRLNEQVKRNKHRFPGDFVFQLTSRENENLRSQIATSSSGYGGRRVLPYVFTEHGAIMAAMVLNSSRAVKMSVGVVRAFVRLRKTFASHVELARKLAQLERKFEGHDEAIHNLFEAVRRLLEPPEQLKRRIGFHTEENLTSQIARSRRSKI